MKETPEQPELFEANSPSRAATPITEELKAHFESGGSIDGAIRLVAALERANKRAQSPRSQGQVRGSRLPLSWRPTVMDVEFAMVRGLSRDRVQIEAEKFTNYWTAKAGTGATKRDWAATWRNWIIAAAERIDVSSSYPNSRRSQTGADAILAGMGRLVRSIDERRLPASPDRRTVPDLTNSPRQVGFDPGAEGGD